MCYVGNVGIILNRWVFGFLSPQPFGQLPLERGAVYVVFFFRFDLDFFILMIYDDVLLD